MEAALAGAPAGGPWKETMKPLCCVLVVAACLVASASRSTAEPMDHAEWDRLMHQYVDADGRVAYFDLYSNDLAALDKYGADLAAADPSAWPANEQLAFWINAYNAGIILAVSHGRSAESLLGRGKLFKFWKFEVAGRKRSLEEIEHKILRKQFVEPRIHFAIVCASTSCPPLRAEAYVADKIDAQLQEQAQRFINDGSRNEFNRAESTIRLSKIFDWFHGDFERQGTLLEFVASYVTDPEILNWLQSGAEDAKLKHLKYDWTLNAQPDQRPR
jgi:hypothetical protein